MKIQSLQRLLLIGLIGPGSLFAAESAAIKAPLHATGDPDATGSVVAALLREKSKMSVSARNLSPSHEFSVEVAGIVEGTMTSDKNGQANIRFRSPALKGQPALDFDPRGQTLRILDGGVSVLEGVVSGDGEDNGSLISESSELSRENEQERSRGRTRYSLAANGWRKFQLNLSNISGGPFTVYIDGVESGEMHQHGKAATLLFDSTPTAADALTLDFDPRGSHVDIRSGSDVVFSGKAEAEARGVNLAAPSDKSAALTSTNADPDASAEARLRIDKRARKHFSVELEQLAVGNYDLLVDGVSVGTISVATITGGTAGEIEFTSGDADNGELPLTFDPAGKTLTITQGGTTYFESVLDPSISSSETPATQAPLDTLENLTSTGLDTDGTAQAHYVVDNQGRSTFSVELEDVAEGTYSLTVAGTLRGTIVAKLASGKVQGEIEFASENDREHKSLNFDPRGQMIEISTAEGIFFSHLFGSGSAAGGGNSAIPSSDELALFNAGILNSAHANAEFEQLANGEQSFSVELEGAPVGSYDLSVGGILRTTITVATKSNGTRGKVEFESEPGKLLLNFVVAGQEVVISQAGVTLFSRTMP